MEPITTTLVAALVAGAVAATKEVAGSAIVDAYNGLKALIARRFSGQPDLADALDKVEARPDSKPRQDMLQEELETARAGQDAEIVKQARALLALIQEQGGQAAASYRAVVRGSGAVAQGPGAVAAGQGGVAVGGNVEGGIRMGGIRADRIEADNVVSGVQMQGGTPPDAAGLVKLAEAIQRGGITAEQIRAGNVVDGLQFLAGGAPTGPDDLHREIAALREHVRQAIARREIEDEGDSEDVQDALDKAEGELARPEPDGKRVIRQLDVISGILTGCAKAAEAAGKIGVEIIKLAPTAAALYQLATAIWR
jgi:hypothetical protein